MSAITYSPDGKLIATAGGDRRVCIWEARTGKLLQDLSGHGELAWGVDFSSDGKVLASVSYDYVLALWDVDTGEEIRREGVEGILETVTGSKVFIGCEWTCPATGERRLIQVGGYGETGAVSPDGRWLAVPYGVTLWNYRTGEPIRTLRSEHLFKHFAFSPDGSLLAGWSGNYCFPHPGPLWLWEVATGRLLFEKWGHETPITAAAFSPDGSALATASDDGTVQLWGLPGGEALTGLSGHFGHAPWIAFSSDGLSIATGGDCSGSSSVPGPADPSIRIWDVPTGKSIVAQEGHGPLTYLPGGTYLASGDVRGYWEPEPVDTKLAILRDAETGRTVRVEGEVVHCLVASRAAPDSMVLLFKDSSDEESSIAIQLIDPTCPQAVRDLATAKGIPVLTFDGRHLAALTTDEEVRIWNLETMEEEFSHGTLGAWSFFTEEGRLLTVDSDEKDLVLRNVVTRQVMARWEGEDWGFALDPERGRLACWSIWEDYHWDFDDWDFDLDWAPEPAFWSTVDRWGPKVLTLRDVSTGEEVARLRHSDPVISAVFSPDGDRILSLARDPHAYRDFLGEPGCLSFGKELSLWDAQTGARVLLLEETDTRGWTWAFCADGSLLALVTEDGVIRVFETMTGEERVTFHPGGARAEHLAFSQDKRMLASSCTDSSVLLWELDGEDPLDPWEALGSADAVAAGRAFQAMVKRGDETVAFVSQKLPPLTKAVDPEIRQVVADLDAADFGVREEASRKLLENLDAAEGEILRLADGDPSPEVRVRIEDPIGILSIPRVLPAGDRARVWRAIAVLERIGSKRAAEVLRILASDLRRAIERQAARDALARLEVLGDRGEKRD